MANEKVIYSVKRSYYRDNSFVCDSTPTFYDSLDKAIDSLRASARIWDGVLYEHDNYLFSYCSFKIKDMDVIESIDSHLLF